MPAAELEKWRKSAVIFPPGQPPQEYVELVNEGLALAWEVVAGGKYEMVVLDELVVALYYGLVSWPALQGLLEARAPGVELVLTGRGATPELIEMADLVTEMREIKHYYTQGVLARKGIES